MPHGVGTLSLQKVSDHFLLGPADNLFLVLMVEVDEIITIACNPDQQVTVFVRNLLCLAQSFRIHDIELDMVTTQMKIVF